MLPQLYLKVNVPRSITIEIVMPVTSFRKNPKKVTGTPIAALPVIRQTGSKPFAHLYVFDAGFPKRQAKFVKAA